uniref:FLYWCH-type domain-containing protein n=1 Tax=Ceratitis capitata TaxID=7213 RepID=W8C0G3_CERCA
MTKIFNFNFSFTINITDTNLSFIVSPWATPCLVLRNYMYNCHSRKNSKEYWRCHNYSKKVQSERCRARCVLEDGKLKSESGGLHNHPPHTEKIEKMVERNRMVELNNTGSAVGQSISRTNIELKASQRTFHMPLRVQQPGDELIDTSIVVIENKYNTKF